MDQKTLQYYSTHAKEVFSRYDSSSGGIEKHFSQAFPRKGRILDIGAGSGRDMRFLVQEGHKAYGIEPCDELREMTVHKYPQLSSRILKGCLPDDLSALFDKKIDKFDGIICSGVFMHIPKVHLFDSIFALKRLLRAGGRVLISIPLDRPDIGSDHRDDKSRLFTDITSDYLELLFERIGFKLLNKWKDKDSLNRKNIYWITLLFELKDIHILRPIDQIEGVLNRDKKVATYKLALFRALCEISMTEFQKARWLPSGKVGIPVQDIAEKWISYYWPLVESSFFIPQIQGEHEKCERPIAFRSKLNDLIKHYQKSGGLPGFTVDLHSRRIPKEIRPLLRKLLTKIKQTIIKGPVTYAGGSLPADSLFDYDKEQKLVLIDASVWKEISLMNHWILDALILRWSELTSRLSKNELNPSEVIDYLLVSPLPEREVNQARQAYKELDIIQCVWSGDTIRRFDIDHVIPFSFWRNNDLWNLLPARPSINLQKKDKLPEHSLLMQRKDAVVYYWRFLKDFNDIRFSYEAAKLLGREIKENWELPLFSALVEAVEVTVLQRGCERWAPK